MVDCIEITIKARTELTTSVTEFVLAPMVDVTLPASEPGAHIAVETPSGAWRQYSLIDPDPTPTCYRIAVKREDNGRGGSAEIHAGWQVGTNVAIQPPKNNFSLGAAPGYLLIAGGIGVTPIYAMAQHLIAQKADFRVIYCTRSREETAYADALEALLGERLTLHHDNSDLDQIYDFWDEFAEPKMMHVYCCGPRALMQDIRDISGHWPEGRVNFEDFAGVEAIREDDTPFEVLLQQSGQKLTVPADRSILETLRDSGIAVASSCESGTCGSCKCGLISGDVDHRDIVLMDEEKADRIMVCVSRAKSGALVLDL